MHVQPHNKHHKAWLEKWNKMQNYHGHNHTVFNCFGGSPYMHLFFFKTLFGSSTDLCSYIGWMQT